MGQAKDKEISKKRDAEYRIQRRKTFFSRLFKAIINLITCIPLLIYVVIHLGWEDNKFLYKELEK